MSSFLTELFNMEMLQRILGGFTDALPRVIGAFILFIIGYFIAKFVAKLVRKVLENIKADELANKLNEIDIIDKSNMKIVPSQLLSKVTYWILMLVTIVAASDFLNMEVVSQQIGKFIDYIPKLIVAVIVLFIGLMLANALKTIVQTACDSLGIPSSKLISNFVFYFILINVVVSALGQADIETDFISDNLSMILGGIVLTFALGYGFASRDIMANVLSSFYSKDKFRIGDVIRVNGVKGEIIHTDSTSVTLQAEDRKVVVPLKNLLNEQVEIF